MLKNWAFKFKVSDENLLLGFRFPKKYPMMIICFVFFELVITWDKENLKSS